MFFPITLSLEGNDVKSISFRMQFGITANLTIYYTRYPRIVIAVEVSDLIEKTSIPYPAN